MTTQNRRLLMSLEAKLREANRAAISAALPGLSLADLNPALKMVAEARAGYLKAFHEIGQSSEKGSAPTPEAVKRLAALRLVYQELVTASQALETAIEREYLDVT